MRHIIITLAAAACTATAQAQQTPQRFIVFDTEKGAISYQTGPLERTEVGRATLKCAYRLRWAKDRAQDRWVEQTFILQCGPSMSKFYDQKVRAIDDMLQDSAPKELQSNPTAYSGGDRLTIFQNMPAGELTLTDSFSAEFYRCAEPMPAFEWRISEDTCAVLGYTCRRAECDFRGRTYTACIDIDTRQYIDTPREKYLQRKREFLLDPIGFFSRNSGVDIKLTKEDGTRNTALEERLRNDSLTYDFLERDYR